jgi:hypothetical protein
LDLLHFGNTSGCCNRFALDAAKMAFTAFV